MKKKLLMPLRQGTITGQRSYIFDATGTAIAACDPGYTEAILRACNAHGSNSYGELARALHQIATDAKLSISDAVSIARAALTKLEDQS